LDFVVNGNDSQTKISGAAHNRRTGRPHGQVEITGRAPVPPAGGKQCPQENVRAHG
jgi:hypothetical protein